MTEIEITIRREVTDRQLRDVLGTALEGGIGYWSWADNIRKIGVADDTVGWQYDQVDLEVPDGGSDGNHLRFSNLNADVLRRGLQLMLADVATHPEWEEGKQLIQCLVEEDDIAGVDATVADLLVQYGVFGEVVYG